MKDCLPVTPTPIILQCIPTLRRLWLLHMEESDEWLHW